MARRHGAGAAVGWKRRQYGEDFVSNDDDTPMPGVPRVARSRRTIPVGSLHEVGRLFQLQYLGAQADQILSSLDDFVAATHHAAPVRGRPYPLTRSAAGVPEGEEAKWERAIWAEWHNRAPGMAFIPGVCSSIVTYQMMLRDTNKNRGWGEVDLVGQSPEGLPVVIELKGPSSIEPPLRGIVEAVAYAIALRKAWKVCLHEQWCTRLNLDLNHSLQTAPRLSCRAVFAAPSIYWDRVLGHLGPKWRVPPASWKSILRLTEGFAGHGVPVSLV